MEVISLPSVSFTKCLSVNKCSESARARRVTQLAQSFDFNLADTFARYLKVLSHFFQRMLRSIFQSESHFNNAFFAGIQRAQNIGSLFLQVHPDHGFSR